MAATSYAIALGGNRRHGRHGAPEAVVEAALAALDRGELRLVARSAIDRNPAMGPAGRGFANATAIVETGLSPPALFARLQSMERAFGRRRGRKWGPRVLDLDIVLWSGGTWPPRPMRAAPGRLTIPHCGLVHRRFVLDPLAEVAPAWREPRSALTVRQLARRLTAARPLHRWSAVGS